MATIDLEPGKKDIIVPDKGIYYEQLVWTIDEVTKMPVGMAPRIITFTL